MADPLNQAFVEFARISAAEMPDVVAVAFPVPIHANDERQEEYQSKLLPFLVD